MTKEKDSDWERVKSLMIGAVHMAKLLTLPKYGENREYLIRLKYTVQALCVSFAPFITKT